MLYRFKMAAISIFAKMWKTTFPKEFFNLFGSK